MSILNSDLTLKTPSPSSIFYNYLAHTKYTISSLADMKQEKVYFSLVLLVIRKLSAAAAFLSLFTHLLFS
jgi:hypothetical protein